MKAALTIAGLALALTGLSGCGDSDDSPTAASEEDFCANFTKLGEEFTEMGTEPDPAAVIKTIKAIADDMEDTGTPEDIADDARDGFEITLEQIDELDDDASMDEFMALGDGVSESDQEKVDAFDDYLSETCDLS
jgi:hypothetical protein